MVYSVSNGLLVICNPLSVKALAGMLYGTIQVSKKSFAA